MAFHGGCACGSVRYEIQLEKLPNVICCHCRDCQTQSGSAFDQTAFVDPGRLDVTGPLVTFVRRMPSGMSSTHNLCGACHTLIFQVHEARPETALLRAGTLDDSEAVMPIAHIFTKRKQAWIKLPDDVPAFAEFPPLEAYSQLFQEG